MDLLRSCYTTKMRFFKDNDLEIPVKWFFCHPSAKVFPEYTLFGSGNWASDHFNWNGPGEVLGAPRKYSKGALVPGFTGQKYCGTLTDFREGAKYTGLPPSPPCHCVQTHCGPYSGLSGTFYGEVTAADPGNVLFVVGFGFTLDFFFPTHSWYGPEVWTAPNADRYLFVVCQSSMGGNFLIASHGDGDTPWCGSTDSSPPFVADFATVKFMVAVLPGPVFVYDSFSFRVTEV